MSLFIIQLRAELLKLFARKRTFIGFGAFLLLEIVVLILFQTKGVTRFRSLIVQQGEAFEKYYSALTVAHIMLGASVFLLGGIYLALVAGDIVAKESEDGHMRLLLARPVSRFRLLLVKYVTCALYTIALVQFITWSAFLMGVLIKGWGGGFFAIGVGAKGVQEIEQTVSLFFVITLATDSWKLVVGSNGRQAPVPKRTPRFSRSPRRLSVSKRASAKGLNPVTEAWTHGLIFKPRLLALRARRPATASSCGWVAGVPERSAKATSP